MFFLTIFFQRIFIAFKVKTLVHDNGRTWHFTALSKPSALGYQLKGADSPVEAVQVD